jgi:hypothetical protein
MSVAESGLPEWPSDSGSARDLAHAPTIPGTTPVAWMTNAQDLTATQILSPIYLEEKAATEPEVAQLRKAMRAGFVEEPPEGYWHTVVDIISGRTVEGYYRERDIAKTRALYRTGELTVTDRYVLGNDGVMDSATVLTALQRTVATDRFNPTAAPDIEDFIRLTLAEGLAAQTRHPNIPSPVLRNAAAMMRLAVDLQIPGFSAERAGFGTLRQQALYFKAALDIDERGRTAMNLNLTRLVSSVYYAVREVQLMQRQAEIEANSN